MNSKYDIKDDELRVIGKPAAGNAAKPKKLRKAYIWSALAVASLAAALCVFLPSGNNAVEMEEEGLFEPVAETISNAPSIPIKEKFGTIASPSVPGYTEKIDTVVNDIPLDIFIPHNAYAELCLRTPDISDNDIIFCAQAADIRKDNKKIVGAFVLKGQPLSWGLSKKGYCAIIDSTITVGVADNSPLFELATEKGGYFFRQYPLIDNGKLVENEPKNKSIRKALCSRNGEIMVIVSNTPESFHDFAQALADLGTDNAIYLVGGEYAKGWYRNSSNEFIDFTKARRDPYKNENYIIWKRK